MRRWLAAAGCALPLVACACSAGDTGTSSHSSSTAPVPANDAIPPRGASVPPTARAALGRLTTLDSCSLVDLRAFRPSGPAAFGDPQSLDYCVVDVQTTAGEQEVHVGEVAAAPTDGSPVGASGAGNGSVQMHQVLPGGVVESTGGVGGGSCAGEATFVDDLSLQVTSTPTDGSPATQTTCDTVDEGLRGALIAVADHHVAHRTYAARSFGPVDACSVLTPGVVAAVLPALAGRPQTAHPAQHQCEVGAAGPHSTYAALVLGAAYARFDGGPSSTTLKVKGHQVVLVPEQPDGRPTECVGYGPHIPTPSRSGQPAMEMAELHVSLPDGSPSAAACRDVRALAPRVFGHLP